MDVKLGMRTHLLAETQNEKPRGDLFKKMLKDFPTHLTSAELEAQLVTKSRYMSVKDSQSTTGSLGYRVSGIVGSHISAGGTSASKAASENESSVVDAFREFAQSASSRSKNEAWIAQKVVEQLLQFRSAMEASAFVRQHECIGSSLLLVVDASTCYCRVFWIDFAKTCVCEQASGLSHRKSPRVGSQEDGLLLGIDNVLSAWEWISCNLSAESRLVDMCSSPIRELNSSHDEDESTLLSKQVRSSLKSWYCYSFTLEVMMEQMLSFGDIVGIASISAIGTYLNLGQ
jgi:hypothetical protein